MFCRPNTYLQQPLQHARMSSLTTKPTRTPPTQSAYCGLCFAASQRNALRLNFAATPAHNIMDSACTRSHHTLPTACTSLYVRVISSCHRVYDCSR
eukprot:516574-Pleurochrysis_carterae.AAC.1